MRRRSGVSVAVAAMIVVGATTAASAATLARSVFTKCTSDVPTTAQCGYVTVPFDRANPSDPATLRIYFELYAHSDAGRPQLGTVLAIEGGPGFSTTASRDNYLQAWQPLSARRDLVLVDLRGTGNSGAIDCHAFDVTALGYPQRAGDCATQLGTTVNLYTTHQAVEDMAAVLNALGISKVDVYGDSYGSYAAQSFTLWHPELVRSLVLDGTYQLPGSDPFWGDLASATRRALILACARRAGCPVTARKAPALVASLLTRVRTTPIRGVETDNNGQRQHVVVTENSLAVTLMGGAFNSSVWRDILAAIVSSANGDNAPLLRLVAEGASGNNGGGVARNYSEGLYLAVTCHDYPQPWDVTQPPAVRLSEFQAGVAALPQASFYPFSAAVWTGTDYEGVTACLNWPAPSNDPVVPPSTTNYPSIPTLVVNGDLDTITPLADAAIVAQRWHAAYVVTRNTTHISILGDEANCAEPIYVRFVNTLATGDTSCAKHIAEVRTVSSFPRNLGQVNPAARAPGDHSTATARRMAAAALMTVADALSRWQINYSGVDRGLRGGAWSYSGSNLLTFVLRNASFVPGVKVTGTATWSVHYGGVRCNLTVAAAGSALHLSASWSTSVSRAIAYISGSGLQATMFAP